MANGEYTFYPNFNEFSVLYRGVTNVEIREGDLWAEYADGWQRIGPCSSYAEAVESGKAGPGTAFDTEEKWIQHIVDTTQNASDAEAYAAGTRGGSNVGSSDPAYHNNSKYYCVRANTFSDNAQNAQTAADAARTASESAQAAAETAQSAAEGFKEDAEAWAVGKINGSNVPSSDARYHNNSKYYSEQASNSADSAETFRDDAQTYAGNAHTSETNAAGSATTATTKASEAAASASAADISKQTAAQWATGGTSGTPSAENNALYYSNQAKLWANNGTDGASPSASNNAKQYAANSASSAAEAKQWANWNMEGSPSATNNAKAYSDSADISAVAAANSEQNATESAYQAESWAVGTRGGAPDVERTGAANNNSYYWAVQSASSATSAGNSATSAATSASNATTSEQNAMSYAGDARDYSQIASNASVSANASMVAAGASETNAVNSASSAAASAETASLWAIGNSSGTPSDVNNALYYANIASEKADSIKVIQFETTYQNSTSGVIIPTSGWSSSPNPVAGRYLWTKTTIMWGDLSTSVFYSVSYSGVNGEGSVDSVNGMGGDVIVDGRNIYLNNDDRAMGTIYDNFSIITNEQIDNLFVG